MEETYVHPAPANPQPDRGVRSASLALLFVIGTSSLSLSISPGPVNLTIVASGVNYGFRRTLPFVTSAALDFVLLLAFAGFWFVRTIGAYLRFFDYLGMVGAVLIAHIGYRITTVDPCLASEGNGVPGLLQGVFLQWPNPKAWIACASGVALFISLSTRAPLLVFTAIHLVACYLSLAVWVLPGDRMALLLDNPWRTRLLNRAMDGTLVLTTGYILYLQLTVSLD